jgi:endonuclease/exonuclease/phosphatase (EEP) superfamily protein YafD
VDAADAAGEGLSPTWPAGQVFPPPVTIDHVLADERIEVGDVSIRDLPGSDHRAVLAQLFVP